MQRRFGHSGERREGQRVLPDGEKDLVGAEHLAAGLEKEPQQKYPVWDVAAHRPVQLVDELGAVDRPGLMAALEQHLAPKVAKLIPDRAGDGRLGTLREVEPDAHGLAGGEVQLAETCTSR